MGPMIKGGIVEAVLQ